MVKNDLKLCVNDLMALVKEADDDKRVVTLSDKETIHNNHDDNCLPLCDKYK